MMGPGVGSNLSDLISKGRPTIEDGIFDQLSPNRDFKSGKKEALK